MRKKSKKRIRAGRILASALGWAVVAVGALSLAFVCVVALGVSLPDSIANIVFVSRLKSAPVLAAVASAAFMLLGIVVLLSVRLIIKDERDGIREERAVYDAREQAIREVGSSVTGIFGDEDDDASFDGDFMPPSCLIDENKKSAAPEAADETKNAERTENAPLPQSDVIESDKTVVPIKSLPKRRKHPRRPRK